jgi:hypothetical protein
MASSRSDSAFRDELSEESHCIDFHFVVGSIGNPPPQNEVVAATERTTT